MYMFKSVPHKDKLKNVSNYCTDCLKCQVLNQAPCLTKIQVQPHPWYLQAKTVNLIKDFVAIYGSLLPDSKQGLSEGQPSPQTKPF